MFCRGRPELPLNIKRRDIDTIGPGIVRPGVEPDDGRVSLMGMKPSGGVKLKDNVLSEGSQEEGIRNAALRQRQAY